MRRLIACLSLLLLGATPAPPKPVAPAASAVSAPAAPVSDASAIDDIAATERSVVRVVTIAVVNGEVVGFGHGSGFAIGNDRIVTNAHVVADAANYPDNVIIGIVPSEGSRSYPGRLLRIDNRRDLAVIQMVSGHVPATSIFTGPVPQRQRVFALGYPGNVDVATAQSMDDYIRPTTPLATDGIISAHDTINGVDALVHDAAIARGNSGGPLVDACGRVIGVNSYITRQDEGDAPFSFAVSVRELAGFLQDSGQRFTAVASPCLSQDEAAARARAEADAAQSMAAADATRRAERSIVRGAELEQLRDAARSRRELFTAFSAVLLALATVAGSGAFTYHALERFSERRAALIAAGALAVGALLLFLLRPDPRNVALPPDPTPPPATAAAAVGFGNLVCTVDPTRGRITVSTGDDLNLAIDDKGCVNGRTQYVLGSDGLWSRTQVPNNDANVARISYDPASGEAVTRRYLLPLTALEALRQQRGATSTTGCTVDPAQLAALAARERTIATMLPQRPNEEIVSRCRPAAAAAPATTAPAASK